METTIAGPAPRGPVLVALACALLWAGLAEGQERVELRRAIPPGTYVMVWNGADSVEIEAWDWDSLVVTGTRSSEAGRFFHSVGDSLGKVGFYADIAREEMVGGELLVRVPAASSVWVKVASADVAVRGSEGSVDVFSVSGSVDVQGSPRTVHVESMTGSVRLALGATDVVRVRGGAGDVTVRGRVLDLSASTVDGAGEAELRARTFSGDIRVRTASETSDEREL